ncbi:MAG: AcrR family transcriptional regulator [Halioglobus sp.]|jgi:AcrR family transcriptional regulator
MASRETQNKVLDQAIRLFNADGTDRVSCNRIAEECKISKGNLHYHFKHKEEIILAIWGRMSQEIETQWGEDAPQPTITHMAEITQRQFNLMWRYRFFYRELTTLLDRDSLLKHRFVQIRKKRKTSIRRFFIALVDHKVLVLPDEDDALESLLRIAWIVTDHWMSAIAIEDKVIDGATMQDGFRLTLQLFMPLLSEQARKDVPESFRVFRVDSEAG